MPRERNLLFDALVDAEGANADEVKRNGSRFAKALSRIKESTKDVTPDEIRRRVENYKRLFPKATVTATAIASHWPRLGGQKADDLRFDFTKEFRRLELIDQQIQSIRRKWWQDSSDGPVFSTLEAIADRDELIGLKIERRARVDALLSNSSEQFWTVDRQLKLAQSELEDSRNRHWNGMGMKFPTEKDRDNHKRLREIERSLSSKLIKL